jgi:hypothetical protein
MRVMTSAEETLQAYRKQHRSRIRWFVIASGVGLLAVLASKLGTDATYPAWKIWLLAHGVVFWPVFLKQAFSKNLVITLEAYRVATRQRDPREGGTGSE